MKRRPSLNSRCLVKNRAGLLFGNEQLARTCESFVGDPFSYGSSPNRTMLETVVQLCQEQGLVRDKPSIEQLFVPGIE